jgi:hypothetical protein
LNKIVLQRVINLLALVLLFLLTVVMGDRAYSLSNNWYVSPTGAGTACSLAQPCSLAYAIGSTSPAQAGDIVWMRGGTYVGEYHILRAGITLRNYQNERATIDRAGIGSYCIMCIDAPSVTVWGLEVTNSATQRDGDGQFLRGTGIDARAQNARIVNAVVHDVGNGVAGYHSQATNLGVYGALLYNNGWREPDGEEGTGYGIYAHSDVTQAFTNTMIWGSYGYGIHYYTEGAAIRNVTFDGLSIWQSGMLYQSKDNLLVGTTNTPLENITVRNSDMWRRRDQDALGSHMGIGYSEQGQNHHITIENNYFAGGMAGISVGNSRDVTFRGNTVHSRNDDTSCGCEWLLVRFGDPVRTSYSVDNNTYYDGTISQHPFYYGTGVYETWANWRAVTGYDPNSTYTVGAPTQNRVFVRPNAYEQGRANITVYNWQNLPAVSVNVSGVLQVGQQYEVRNAQNFYAPPVLQGVYGGGSISIPMSGWTIAQPVGEPRSWPTTAPEFGAFVLMGGQAPQVTPSPTGALSTPTRTAIPVSTSTPQPSATSPNTPTRTRTRTVTPTATNVLALTPTPTRSATSVPTNMPTQTPVTVNCPSAPRRYIQPSAPPSPPNCADWYDTSTTPWKHRVFVPSLGWVDVP